jgi:putative ABC transport system permease protein
LVAFKQKHFLEERKAGSDIVLLPLHGEHFRGGSGQRILSILGIIALAILLISCINFINLSISQLLQRTREIGVRKVLGGRPGQLIIQFMSESMIVCLLSGLTGLIGAYFLVPLVAGNFDFGINIHNLRNLSTLFFLTGICFTVAMLSSFWPSVILSGLKIENLMKDAFDWNKSGGLFRKTLMVLQFSTSIFLIIGTIIIWQQIQFMKNQDLKFDGAHVVAMEYYPELFKSPEEAQQKLSLLRDELIREPSIESMTIANSVPGKYSHNYNWFEAPDSQGVKGLSLRQLTVDHQFFETFKIKFLTGRNFSLDLESDKNAVVINERAMKELGWTDLEGKSLKPGGDDVSHKVVGVVEDYYYQSMKDLMQPVIHFYHPEASGVVAVRLHPENVTEGLAILKEKWSGLDPYEPFAYAFVDATFDQFYKEHQRLGTTSTFFSVVALVLAGLGLFSLSAYSIRLRRKEIGIRKVLGASIYHIVTILSRNFGLLIVLGFMIACPLVYYLMRIFLQDFAYHIPLTPGVFLLGGFTILIIFMGLVGIQSLKAARESPSVSIKDE